MGPQRSSDERFSSLTGRARGVGTGARSAPSPWPPHASDILQHVAVLFEISAVALLFQDYRTYRSDSAHQQRAAVAGMILPKRLRSTEFRIAVVVGAIAIAMEVYQLATQYLHC